MAQDITISVVCPTFNSAGFVRNTLETVQSQTRLPDELIVSDDGSTDDTVGVVEEFLKSYTGLGKRILKNPHCGPGSARNAGVRASTSQWIAFLDSDDLWLPSKLEAVVAAMQAHPAQNFFCHNEEHRRLDGSKTLLNYGANYRERTRLSRQLFLRNLFSTSAVICRREIIIDSGMFDENLMSGQDYELWLRMSPLICPGFIPAVLGVYVDRPGNITSGKLEKRLWNQLRILWRHRQKASGLLFLRMMMANLVIYGLAKSKVALSKAGKT